MSESPRIPSLSSKWFQWAKSQEDKDKINQTVRNSGAVLDLLTKVLEKELQEVESVKTEDYLKPAWAFYRADKDGAIRTLRQIITLTKLLKD